MNGRFDRLSNLVSVRIASALLVLGVLVGVFATVQESVGPTKDISVHASVPTVSSFRIVANRTVASRTDSIEYRVWLNLTGGGLVQYAWVNVTFDPDLDPVAGGATTPSGCALGVDTTWQCNGLHQGVYAWTIHAVVDKNATVNRSANATATVLTYANRQYSPIVQDVAGVQIASLVLDLRVLSEPVNAIRLREQVHFTIIVRNNEEKNNETARNVTVHVDVSPWLLPSAARDYPSDNLTTGSVLSFAFTLIVAENASIGSSVWIRVRLTYEDSGAGRFGPIFMYDSLLVVPAALVSPTNLVAGVLVGLAAVVATIAGLLFVGQRRLRIDEVFLVHSSGALIQHVSRMAAVKKDDDLMAAMLVAVQAFVKDSLKREDTLDEFAFGPRKGAIVRGKYVVLAAILSGGDPAYLLPQLRAAVHAIEQAHGPVLANWDGRLARLNQTPEILERLMRGGYRKEAWVGWVEDAKGVLHRSR